LVAKWRNTIASVMPAESAICRVATPLNPCCANSSVATSSICLFRSGDESLVINNVCNCKSVAKNAFIPGRRCRIGKSAVMHLCESRGGSTLFRRPVGRDVDSYFWDEVDMKRIVLFLAVFALAMPVMAQDWARAKVEKSTRHREWVTVKHDGRSVETFVVYPESRDKTPVVLVIHEIFGLTDW